MMRVTVSTITEAVIDVMRASTPGGIVDQTLAARISGEIAPALQKALTSPVGSGAELSSLSVFRNILNQHLATPASAYAESETRKAMLRVLDNANRTGSAFSSLLANAGAQFAQGVLRESARGDGSGEHRASERVSSAAMTRDTPLSVDGAIGFAKELGISPSYAGLFAGGSHVMCDALRDAITKGAAITDDKVKSMSDVGMVLGAIRAGKLKPDDPRIPPSVRHVIDEMKSRGIDPVKADPKTIQKYLKDNPDSLATFKKANAKATGSDAGLSDSKVKTKNVAAEHLAKQVALQTKAATKEKTSGLGL